KVESGKLFVEKHVGKIGSSILNSQFSTLNSHIALGHTRWATHGGVTRANAHPHLDCSGQIAVVHNGIVENFQDLKDELSGKGHKFISETDTEVIPHLIEEFLKKEGFASAVRDTFNKLKGLNAIVVMSSQSSEIIAAKNGSPLVAGIGKEEFFIASDAVGIVKHTKKVVFIEDNQMAILGNGLKLIALPKGQVIKPAFHNIDWKFEETEKGQFKHFFLKEIYEQPKVLENIAINSGGTIQKIADLIKKAFGTFFVACGSASYSALAGTYLFSKLAKKHVNFAIGSEFNYLEDYIGKGTLVIPISQSGESVDVIQPVVRAKEKGAKIAGIINTLGSTLYRESDFKMLLGAGPEKAVVATKSLTAMMATMILIAYSLIKKQKLGQSLVLRSAKDVREILGGTYIGKIKKVARLLKNKEHIYVIGRGLAYATALEATLKLKEAAYIHAEGFPGGELKHGVIALIDRGTPCIVFAPNDETYDEVISNAQEISARGGYIIGVGPRNNRVFDKWLETGDCGEATMIPQIVIAQLLAYYLALERGIKDPDKPRNLAKSVTVK
ncbi:glutamine--fructose-6-phosphate transaminase (isomerizing), partial [Candidatus Curtissbacteria bacterium]|nr:glutamine--fructose-6-phosphate transaminase (isomerizing) [Candidatus Curtissbacteria bacterium]